MRDPLPSADAPMRTVRQVLVRQLAEAIAGLGRRDPSDRAVHEARKELKRARAALRLLRRCIGDTAYQRENALIRDAAKPLTPLRDAKVLLETLRRLESATRGGKPGALAQPLNRLLQQERRGSRQLRPKELSAAAKALIAVKRRMEAVSDSRLARASLGMGLVRTYKSGRRAFASVRRNATNERLHEWRKQVKYFANQLDIAMPFVPKLFAKSGKTSHRLAERLGDDHDLALLNDKICRYAEGTSAAGQNSGVRELTARLAGRRKTLQDTAHRLGRRLYAPRPRRIEAKLGRERARIGRRSTKS
jgi:CHAD domain-containing protein